MPLSADMMIGLDPDGLAETLAGSLMAMADMEAAVQEANGLDVPLWAFKKAVRFVARARKGLEQDLTRRALAMVIIIDGRLDPSEILPVSRAIELRMQAWDVPGQSRPSQPGREDKRDGLEAIDELLVEIAARQPLIVRDGRPAFETERFFQATARR